MWRGTCKCRKKIAINAQFFCYVTLETEVTLCVYSYEY